MVVKRLSYWPDLIHRLRHPFGLLGFRASLAVTVPVVSTVSIITPSASPSSTTEPTATTSIVICKKQRSLTKSGRNTEHSDQSFLYYKIDSAHE